MKRHLRSTRSLITAQRVPLKCRLGAGYLIPPSRSFKPVRLHGQWTTLFVTFEKSEEAQAFCEWLKKANADAERSFTRMLD
jgi:hypothetical protein